MQRISRITAHAYRAASPKEIRGGTKCALFRVALLEDGSGAVLLTDAASTSLINRNKPLRSPSIYLIDLQGNPLAITSALRQSYPLTSPRVPVDLSTYPHDLAVIEVMARSLAQELTIHGVTAFGSVRTISSLNATPSNREFFGSPLLQRTQITKLVTAYCSLSVTQDDFSTIVPPLYREVAPITETDSGIPVRPRHFRGSTRWAPKPT